jgi:ElaB/YqjD/DUF883 family membrane-anchored ribosome-binding protein
MARKNGSRNGATSDEVAEIEREINKLMRDLEGRVARLNSITKRGASHAADEAREFISNALFDAADRLRQSTEMATDEAARFGQDALHRIEEEIEQRPLLTLAVAAGIGFLAGMAGRRQQ